MLPKHQYDFFVCTMHFTHELDFIFTSYSKLVNSTCSKPNIKLRCSTYLKLGAQW